MFMLALTHTHTRSSVHSMAQETRVLSTTVSQCGMKRGEAKPQGEKPQTTLYTEALRQECRHSESEHAGRQTDTRRQHGECKQTDMVENERKWKRRVCWEVTASCIPPPTHTYKHTQWALTHPGRTCQPGSGSCD